MKNRRRGTALLLAVVLALTACQAGASKETLVDGVETVNSDTMSMEYGKFNGERTGEFTVAETEEAWIQVDIITTKGSLDVSITDADGNFVYSGQNIRDSQSFSVKAESGTYTIQVTGHDHEGSYSFQWNRKELDKDVSITEGINLEDKAHNVYSGTIGEKQVLVDIFPDKELFEAYITIVGNGIGTGEPCKATYDLQGILNYDSETMRLTLAQGDEDKLTGSFSGADGKEQQVNLGLFYITFTGALDKRYVIGSSEDVESFASEVLHIVDAEDWEALSTLVNYPITVKGSEDVELQNEKELVEYGAKLITPELKQSLESTPAKLMFSNYNGIMLGDGYYNIWFSQMEDGTYKIIGINH